MLPALVGGFSLLFVGFSYVSDKSQVLENLASSSISNMQTELVMARGVAESFLASDHTDFVQQTFTWLGNDVGHEILFVTNAKGQIIASSRIELNGTYLRDSGYDIDAEQVSRAGMGGVVEAFLKSDQTTLMGYASVCDSAAGQLSRPEVCGFIYHEGSIASQRSAVLNKLKRHAVLDGVAILALTALLLLVIHLALTRKVGRLVKVANRFSGKTLDIRTGLRGSSELDTVGEAIDLMLEKIAADHAEQERTLAYMAESEERMRHTIEGISSGLIASAEDGTIQFFNRAAEKIFQYSASEIIGRSVSILAGGDVGDKHHKFIGHYLSTREAKVIGHGREVLGKRKDGSEFPMMISLGEVVGGRGFRFVATIEDLTERHALEAQLQQSQKMEALGQLTGGMAHDFNNLLAIIDGNLSLLLEDMEEGKEIDMVELRDLTDSALGAARRGANLTHRLLAFSRQQALKPVTVNVNRIVENMAPLLRRTLGEATELVTCFEPDPWLCEIDASQLENAILNLALNARDAMRGVGKLTIEICGVRLDEDYAKAADDVTPGDYVMLAVSDTGVGMTPDIQKMVFEPFFTTKEAGRGSGLGLSMVYGFAKQSGGHAAIYSEVGKGTAVKLYLPRARGAGGELPEERRSLSRQGGSERVLVVENDPEVLKTTVRMLSKLGYVVLEVESGPDALELVARLDEPVDLVLSDVIMPGGMSGPQLARELAEQGYPARVMFMSGYTENAIVHDGRIDDGVILLNKPFSIDDIAAKVREALD
jgi:PAS domain S-box-containing protein